MIRKRKAGSTRTGNANGNGKESRSRSRPLLHLLCIILMMNVFSYYCGKWSNGVGITNLRVAHRGDDAHSDINVHKAAVAAANDDNEKTDDIESDGGESDSNINVHKAAIDDAGVSQNKEKEDTEKAGPKTHTWKDWPAVAYEEVDHNLVMKGDTFFNHAREHYFTKDSNTGKTLMDEFLEIYRNRPDKTNLCGIRINHALALFLGVIQIEPSLVVESGVNAGQSTYFIRAASKTTKIFAIDPLDKPICDQGDRWIDESELTTYYTGEKFVDLVDLDWKGMIEKKEVDPEKTLVFIDDHMHVLNRITSMMQNGIKHIISEDNYKAGEGATPHDKQSTLKQYFSFGLSFNDKTKEDIRSFFDNHVKKYAEFPALVPPIVSKESKEPRKRAGGFMVAGDKNDDIVHPVLRPDLDEDDMKLYKDIALKLGYDPELKDKESYMQFMNYNQIAYLELSPRSSSKVYKWPT